MSRRRTALVATSAAVAGTAAALRLRKPRRNAFPPPPDAMAADEAKVRAETLAAMPRVGRSDRVLDFAPSSVTSFDPLLHGTRYFPRMLEDIKAATTSVHLLIYGFQPGDIGTEFRDALVERAAAGVEVRLAVDAIGSQVDFNARGLYADLRSNGVTIVANDGLFPDRDGAMGERRFDWHMDDFLHFDHRKMLIVDGTVAYVGGSGIEDHYNDERFYDVMCRVTGPVVAQLQTLFIATFRYQGGEVPAEPGALDHLFPAAVPGETSTPVWVLDNVPGEGHHPISDAIEQSLEEAARRIHIVNPYIADRAILERILDAAERGVSVSIVAPGKPTPPYPAAAFRHWYERLMDAGVEILLHPQMAHAKVLIIDDRVFVGGCNLDDLSLFRNNELDLLLEGPEVVEKFERQIFDELVGMSTPATLPSGARERYWNAAMDRISRFL
jgi:cardiolipin synthase